MKERVARLAECRQFEQKAGYDQHTNPILPYTDSIPNVLIQLKNDNKKSEYYLTDIYSILRKAGKKVVAVRAAGTWAETTHAPAGRSVNE